MKTIKIMALLAAAFVMTGCGLPYSNTADKSAYDEYYKTPAANKMTFAVPYAEFKPLYYATVDTRPVLDALKKVFANEVAFDATRPEFVVIVRDVKIVKPLGLKLKCTVKATYIPTHLMREQVNAQREIEVVSEYYDYAGTLDARRVLNLYNGAALDLATQIKTITDTLAKK